MASSPRRKSRTPHTTPAAAASSRPDTPTIGVNTPRPKKSITPSSAGTGTPVSAPSSKKKGRVDTPTVPRIRTRRSSCSSLYTISEEVRYITCIIPEPGCFLHYTVTYTTCQYQDHTTLHHGMCLLNILSHLCK